MVHCSTNLPSGDAVQLECLLRLVELTAPRETARAIVDMVQRHFGCSARVVMWLEDVAEAIGIEGGGRPDRADMQRVAALMAGEEPLRVDGRRVDVRLDDDRAALLLLFPDEVSAPVLDALVIEWLASHGGPSLRAGYTVDYAQYVETLRSWGAPHGLGPANVEERIFRLIRDDGE